MTERKTDKQKERQNRKTMSFLFWNACNGSFHISFHFTGSIWFSMGNGTLCRSVWPSIIDFEVSFEEQLATRSKRWRASQNFSFTEQKIKGLLFTELNIAWNRCSRDPVLGLLMYWRFWQGWKDKTPLLADGVRKQPQKTGMLSPSVPNWLEFCWPYVSTQSRQK